MKKTLGIAMILIVALGVTMIGLAADQTVTVNIPAYSNLTLSASTMDITFPSLDTWTGDTNTVTTTNFNIISRHNGALDPDIQVTSSPLTLNGGGASAPTIDRAGFIVSVTPQNGTAVNGALNGTVNVPNVGKGIKTASAHYALTINADQQSGTYTGTVVYTLVNQ